MVHVLLRLTEEQVEGESGKKEDETPEGEEEEDSRMKADNERDPLKSTADIKSARDSLTHRINMVTTKLIKCVVLCCCSITVSVSLGFCPRL